MQQALDYPTESQIKALQPQEFVNIRQTQEQINLLRRIANAVSNDSSRSILSRLIILILLICLYGWLTNDFYDANGFTLRATTNLLCMTTGAFIVLCGLIIQNIYKKINGESLFRKILFRNSCFEIPVSKKSCFENSCFEKVLFRKFLFRKNTTVFSEVMSAPNF